MCFVFFVKDKRTCQDLLALLALIQFNLYDLSLNQGFNGSKNTLCEWKMSKFIIVPLCTQLFNSIYLMTHVSAMSGMWLSEVLKWCCVTMSAFDHFEHSKTPFWTPYTYINAFIKSFHKLLMSNTVTQYQLHYFRKWWPTHTMVTQSIIWLLLLELGKPVQNVFCSTKINWNNIKKESLQLNGYIFPLTPMKGWHTLEYFQPGKHIWNSNLSSQIYNHKNSAGLCLDIVATAQIIIY